MSSAKPATSLRHGAATLTITLLAALCLTTCVESNSIECPTGIVCPAGTTCAVNQQTCIEDDCGDFVTQPDEKCDDGNIIDGDGCSATCDSDETCGNGVIDDSVGENCDDGNKDNDDRCPDGVNGTCLDATCGDDHTWDTDGGEEDCDDGNQVNDDACRNDCKDANCGDGVEQSGEGCDDGDHDNSDDCPDGEDGTCLPANCGDGHTWSTDGGFEECDDENQVNGDDCDNNCTESRCGNGEIGGDEICDDGGECQDSTSCVKASDCVNHGGGPCTPQPGDKCSADCKSDEECGNDIIDDAVGEFCDHGKQCEDLTSGTCLSTEVPPRCTSDDCCIGIGDEECKPRDGTGCSADCKSGEQCGNKFQDPGEQCDDDTVGNNDNCPNDLTTGTCEWAYCGDNFTCTALVCTSGPADGPEECDTIVDSQTCNADCSTPFCGDGYINQSFDPPESPVGTFEQCDPGTPGTDTALCDRDCTTAFCGDGHTNAQTVHMEDCDASGANTAGCNADCTSASCGDGYYNPATDTECDDGNASNNDNCLNSCLAAYCGDGYVNGQTPRTEECDGNGTGTGGETMDCNTDCTNWACGDGKVNATRGEECDNLGGGHSATCDDDCTAAFCGDNTTNNQTIPPEACDDAGNTAGCNADCTAASCDDGYFNPNTDAECDDGTGSNLDDCLNNCHYNICGDGWVNGQGPVTEQCDGNGTGTGGETTDCNADCTNWACGDGKVNATRGEECDNLGGGHSATCDDDCTAAFCGDNTTNDQTVPPEDCDDDGNSADCNADCTSASCGDGYFNSMTDSQCDTGANTASCDTDCTIPECDDGIFNAAAEPCDDGDADNNDDCLVGCVANVCGDGWVNMEGPSTEVCDDGNTDVCGTCNGACGATQVGGDCPAGTGCASGADCTSGSCLMGVCDAVCGDGITEGTESCDDSNTDACGTCSADCSTVQVGGNCGTGVGCDSGADCSSGSCTGGTCDPGCGDGVTEAPEVCDDNNSDGCGTCNATCTATQGGGDCPADMGCGVDGDCASDSCTGGTCDSECGNGIQETGETCDDGNLDACGTCSTDCQTVQAGGDCPGGEGCAGDGDCASDSCTGGICDAECGNGVPEGGETCDDGNDDNCGTCSAGCNTDQPAQAATGTITTVLAVAETETFTIDDGFNGPTIFEFDTDASVSGSNVAVDINGAANANDIRDAIITAITTENGTGFFNVSAASGGGATVDLTHDVATSLGNVTILEGVADAGFLVAGMSNGQAGDCPIDTGCVIDADCASDNCDGNICTPVCGDAVTEPPESCDDGNADNCGTCSQTCDTAQPAAAATGTITTIAPGDIGEGETFTIDDGFNAPTTVFEFDTDTSVTGSNVAVDISGATDADDVRDAIILAVNGVGGTLEVAASDDGAATVALLHDRTSAIGNRPLAEDVVDGNFAIAGMTGGAAGNCIAGTGCLSGDDCISGSCTGGTCD